MNTPQSVQLTVTMHKEDNGTIVAHCKELDIYAYGQCHGQAMHRLQQVIVFYYDTMRCIEEGRSISNTELN